MSTGLTYYIEFREKTDKPWQLVKPLVDLNHARWKKESYERKQSGTVYEDDSWEMDDIVNVNGKLFTYQYDSYRQGIIRDLFSHSFDNCDDLSDRGFPNDLSEGLKEILDFQQKRIDDENAKETPMDTSGFKWNHEYRWGKSYFTLKELAHYANERYEEALNNLLDAKHKNSLESLGKRMERLEELIINPTKVKLPKVKKSSEEEKKEYKHFLKVEEEYNKLKKKWS